MARHCGLLFGLLIITSWLLTASALKCAVCKGTTCETLECKPTVIKCGVMNVSGNVLAKNCVDEDPPHLGCRKECPKNKQSCPPNEKLEVCYCVCEVDECNSDDNCGTSISGNGARILSSNWLVWLPVLLLLAR